MNARMRYITAAVCAVLAGFLTLLYLSGRSAAGESETEVIWVARQAVAPGTRLSEEMLQRVRVDGPTRKLLARDALPTTPADSPGQWYATGAIASGQALLPGRNVAHQPAPKLPGASTPADLRVVTLAVEAMPSGTPQIGEEVDIYAIPARGGEAVRILARTRVLLVGEGLIAVLVPEAQVAAILTATDKVEVKVVRHLQGMAL